MRSFFSIIVLSFVLISCEDQVKFNNPAVQGLKDNVLWRATLINAVEGLDGSLTIEAYQNNDILTLKTASVTVKTYPLGVNDVDKVVLVQKEGNVSTIFSTGENRGNGQIVITEYDAVNHTITGEFEFNAQNEVDDLLAIPNVYFTKGVFYKVPLKIALK